MNPTAILKKIEAKYPEIINEKETAEKDNRRLVEFTGKILQKLSLIFDNVIFIDFLSYCARKPVTSIG